MKIIFNTFALIIFLLLPLESFAKIYIDITGPSGKRIPIAVQSPKIGKSVISDQDTDRLAKKVDDQLLFNLDFARYFDVIERDAFIEDIITKGMSTRRIDFQNWRLIGSELLVSSVQKVTKNRLIIEMKVFDVVTEKQIMGKRYFTHLNNPEIIANRFIDDLTELLTGVRGIFSTKILFTSKQTGNKEIYISNIDGKRDAQLTNNKSINLTPSWHPDGRSFLYTSYKKGGVHLFEQDISSGKSVTIAKMPGFNIGGSYSRDGNNIALSLSKDGNPEIYLIDLKKSKFSRITNNYGIDVSPDFSPDSKSIIYLSDKSGNPNIYMINLPDGHPERISFSGGLIGDPQYSPDGTKIAFARMKKGVFNIWVMDSDGSNARQLTFEGQNKSPSWSPDSRYLVFDSERNNGKGIYIISLDGQMLYKVPLNLKELASPSWSPYRN